MELGINVIDVFREQAQVDREFREGCLVDTVDWLMAGEFPLGMLSLHDHIYATMGFEKMGELIGKSPDEVVEMLLPPNGDPPASTLFKIIGLLMDDEAVDLKLSVARRDATEPRDGATGSLDWSIERQYERQGERMADLDGEIDEETDGGSERAAERVAASAGAG